LNRQHASVQDAVGLFVNSLPVRQKVDGSATAAEHVRTCHAELLEAFRHGRYPSYRLLREAKLPSRLSRSPLYEQLFSYYENTVVDVTCPQTQLKVTELELPRGTSKYDLSLFVTRAGDRLACKVEYATALFAERDAAAFVELYEFVLERMIENPGGALRDLVSAARERAVAAGLGPAARAPEQAERRV
jgi:non-ribosomal peptide synthetase component F